MEELVLSTGMAVSIEAIHLNIKKIINQVYKLLPMREEGKDWKKLLETLIEQISGMKRLIKDQDHLFFLLLCKLEGLFSLDSEDKMGLFRRVIFESLNLLNNLDKNVCD